MYQKIFKQLLTLFFIISVGYSNVAALENSSLTNPSGYQNMGVIGISDFPISEKERAKIERKIYIQNKIKELIQRKNEQKIAELRKERVRKLILRNREKEGEFNSAGREIVFSNNFDISSRLKYKRIQEKSLSCELSATSDLLSYLENKNISEISVINMVDKSKYNEFPSEENGKKIWGNPNAGYVGYIDKLEDGKKAKQSSMTGYGVLEKPIAKIFNTYKYATKTITNKNYHSNYSQKEHLTEILKSLSTGNVVQLWGDYCTDPQFEDTNKKNNCDYFENDRTLTWYYKEGGKLVKHEGLSGEHAFYLLGYRGGVENPTHIVVWDTMTGKHTYPVQEWMRKWNMMQNRSIIVLKK